MTGQIYTSGYDTAQYCRLAHNARAIIMASYGEFVTIAAFCCYEKLAIL